jgi:hypothetical protein
VGNKEAKRPSGIPKRNLDALRALADEVERHVDNPTLPGDPIIREVASNIRRERKAQEEAPLGEKEAQVDALGFEKELLIKEITSGSGFQNWNRIGELVGIVGINARLDKEGNTALMHASNYKENKGSITHIADKEEAEYKVALLINLGADPTLKNNHNETAKDIAKVYGIINLLKEGEQKWRKKV